MERMAFQTRTVSAAALVLTSSEDDEQCLLTSTPVKKPTPIQTALVSPCPSTPGGLNTSASSIGVCPTDESYQLESTIPPTSSSSSEEEGVKDWREKKIIVNESSLMSLFRFCQMCGKTISSKVIFDSGAQRKVKWICFGGHSGTWTSSPDLRGMPSPISSQGVIY
ncbi:hypothetical protein R3I93_020568 [Phoxinus phoxinus]|uniref:Uncharacterized protein n=1 Tax=Phoxinus phoxinus TaxID=58324 RepID=A0AAN9CC93_9TELE